MTLSKSKTSGISTIEEVQTLNKSFVEFVHSHYGERAEALIRSLLMSETQAARPNGWVVRDALAPSEPRQNGLLTTYIMDPSSIVVAHSLEVGPEHRILDLCAAPGGKTLVLIEDAYLKTYLSRKFKNPEVRGAQPLISSGADFSDELPVDFSGELIANELSKDRRERLTMVLRQYVPEVVRNRVWVKGKDGVQYGLREPSCFDRILLDAPCSGERHLLENPSQVKEWTAKKTKNLAIRQYSLLSSAWLALKPGGRLVYSTCSISPLENDGVIAKLLKRHGSEVLLGSLGEETAGAEREKIEKTAHGFQFLPDRCGFGPMYFSILLKSASASPS